jgi:hypothetical protein
MADEAAKADTTMANWQAETSPVRAKRLAGSETLRGEHETGPRNIAPFANAYLAKANK